MYFIPKITRKKRNSIFADLYDNVLITTKRLCTLAKAEVNLKAKSLRTYYEKFTKKNAVRKEYTKLCDEIL